MEYKFALRWASPIIMDIALSGLLAVQLIYARYDNEYSGGIEEICA
ncbi:hypothetical protein C900_00430 [Fulvivirga imtechensis AK7]|uniref:Uncharacterized protein n=1 Tax=Fulvivirga imtechensis AK7 TaxID=1237149 RepID=L8JJI0_9BACT|nr:hypothetical protein C900_00430 [Fulvivirga imtechensis AK7]